MTPQWQDRIGPSSRVLDLHDVDVRLDLRGLLGVNLHLSCEGFNFAGSIKLRTARWLFRSAQRAGLITSGSTIVESSSGNMGVALALVAAAHDVRFICVTDSRCTPSNIRLMNAFGAEVQIVECHGEHGSLLAARKRRVRDLCAENSTYVWLDQYSNPAGYQAHYELTAPLIADRFPGLTALFVGVGTGGTAVGCARYFAETAPEVEVIAVDSAGSVNFGNHAGIRRIPGIGASEPMPFVDRELFHDVVLVDEEETVRTCRQLASRGILLGGSSGTVVSAARSWLSVHDPAGAATAVALAPDLGDRYLDTLYNDDWVSLHYPQVLDGPGPADSDAMGFLEHI
jgi:2,3-diaminopropionate biosynthesis protein SbnA